MTCKTTQRILPFTEVKIACYIRVSTQRQAVEGDSLEAQENAIRRHIESQKAIQGWTEVVVTIFNEPGKSAQSMKRPVLQKMLDGVRAGEFTHVIAHKLDRVTRSLRDFREIRDLLEKHHTALVLVEDNFESGDPRSQAIYRLMEIFAEFERSRDV